MTIKQLAALAPGEDVRAKVAGESAAIWLWNAKAGCHEPLSLAEAHKVLGGGAEVIAFARTLREVA